jgi:hypothetical protein
MTPGTAVLEEEGSILGYTDVVFFHHAVIPNPNRLRSYQKPAKDKFALSQRELEKLFSRATI